MPIKVVVDTDIGSDIDDAICLAYLLANPECELLGITTVTGEPDQRAMMASALCKIANKPIPIFPGAAQPLFIQVQQPYAPQAHKLNQWKHDTLFPHGEAIEFLRRTIRAHPGEVVLLGIGPMTNIALLFSIDPEIPSLLKKLVLMCGVFTQDSHLPPCEWNALNDPHAASIVYHAHVPHHQSFGLDVTTQVTMNSQQFREKCSNIPLLQPVLHFADVWFEHNKLVTFHDPLAATTIFNSSICTLIPGTITVELEDKTLAGKTYWNASSSQSQHEIALEVNAQLFFEEYFRVF